MRDRSFIAWLVGLLVMPFILDSYAPALNSPGTTLPLMAGFAAAVIIIAMAVTMMSEDVDERKERKRSV